MLKETARERWSQLERNKTGLVMRCERYSQLTLPTVCPVDGYDENSTELATGADSYGALLVNSLTNKMMLAMFAPSRPFLRIDLPKGEKNKLLQAMGMSESQFREDASVLEQDAVRYLDSVGARPKLYELIRHLIVTGNALRLTRDDTMRIYGVKKFCSRRNVDGKVIELIIKETVCFDELPDDIQAEVPDDMHTEDTEVSYYIVFCWDARKKRYIESQWVDDYEIQNKNYRGNYTEDEMPATHHTWTLPSGHTYGVGHVETYVNDHERISGLSQSEMEAVIMAAEFRWLADPAGITRVEDINNSKNGDTIPGRKDELSLVNAGASGASAVASISAAVERAARRLGQAYMMAVALQRDGERVTAEEWRILATELETTLGGVYSEQAQTLQKPLANWLLKQVGDAALLKSDFKPVIVTGLDALSRTGDLDALRGFISDVTNFLQLPPESLQYMRVENTISSFASGWRLSSSEHVKTAKEIADAQAKSTAVARSQMAEDYATQKTIDKATK